MTSTTARPVLFFVGLSAVISIGYVAFREDLKPVKSVRVDTTDTETGKSELLKQGQKQSVELDAPQDGGLESVQPNIHSVTPEEYAATWQSAAESWQRGSDQWQRASRIWRRRAEKAEAALARCMERNGEAAATTQPLWPAETRTVHFDKPAVSLAPLALFTEASDAPVDAPTTPTPILDERVRPCVGIPIPANLTAKRMNLLLTPNLREVMRRSWSDPKWREMFGVGRIGNETVDMFSVNLWRKRQGIATLIKQVRVPAGPELPNSVTQIALSSMDFRGGDVLCVESPHMNGPLLVAYDPQTGLVVEPRLSVIEVSNDATAMPGRVSSVSSVGGVKP